MKSNIALSYIAMLSIVGFFLWLIRNFVRGLRQKGELLPVAAVALPPLEEEKKPVDWPVHVFLSKADDIPIPGRLTMVSPVGAYLESALVLQMGQELSLYVDIPGRKPLRVSGKVLWSNAGRGGRSAAQLSFQRQQGQKEGDLYQLA